VRLTVAGFDVREWWRRWQQQRQCLHHARTGGWSQYQQRGDGYSYPVAAGDPEIVNAVSYVECRLIDLGRHKLFTCRQCGKRWTLRVQ